MAETLLFEERTLEGFTDTGNGYLIYAEQLTFPAFVAGETYRVLWDGTEYSCLAGAFEGSVFIGNMNIVGLDDGNGEPFLMGVGNQDGQETFMCATTQEEPSHTVSIYRKEKELPSADIKIKGYSGTEFTYEKVPKVYLAAPESTPDNPVLVPFSFGETLEDVEIIPDFSEGDMRVEMPYGYLAKSAIIKEIKKTDPYIEYVLNDEGQIISASLYNFTTIPTGCFAYMTALESVDFSNSPGITAIGDSAFRGCSALPSVNIPDTVESIGNSAFYGCSALSSVNIPDTVESIGNSAFYGCSALSSVNIPDTVESIGDYAFRGCSSLTSINIPERVTSIGTQTFYECSALTSIDIPESVTSIETYAFYKCTGLTSIVIPIGVDTIGSETFNGCSSLISVELPDTVKTIGINAFYNCVNLQNIDLSNVTTIERQAFFKTSLTSVNLIGLTTIMSQTFAYCSKLNNVTLGNVIEIQSAAFSDCSALTNITIPSSVTSIEVNAFRKSGLTSATFLSTSGWWRSTSATATSGTSISNLANAATAATYLKTTYVGYYWKRS